MPWYSVVSSYLMSIPLSTWATVSGIVVTAGVSIWLAVSKMSGVLKAARLRLGARWIEALVVEPLRAIAPTTRTSLDDAALVLLEESLRRVRAAADNVKTPHAAPLRAVGMALVLGSALLSGPAVASEPNPLHVCLVGCGSPEEPAGASLLAGAELRLSPVLWMGPGVVLPAAERDGLTREWGINAVPAAAWVLSWRPKAWPLEGPALSLALSARVGYSAGVTRIDVLPMLTIANLLSAGAGVRCELPSGGGPDRCALLLAFGAGWAP